MEQLSVTRILTLLALLPLIKADSYWSLNYPVLMQKEDTFTCPNIGYYPDYTDVKCQRYVYCAKIKGEFKPYIYSCPPNVKWDPSIRRCSTTYVCPYTLPPTTAAVVESTTMMPFVCTEPGRFLNRNVRNCSGYIYCGQMCNRDEYTMKFYDCPPPSTFDATISMCSTLDTKCSIF